MDLVVSDVGGKIYNGKVFDLWDKGNCLFITDYHYLNREILPNACNGSLDVGGKKRRKTVNSIKELRRSFEELISVALQIIQTCNMDEYTSGSIPIYFDFSVNESEKSLLVDQLVFDVLFDKYCIESEIMTRASYSKHMAKILCEDSIEGYRTINEALRRGMKKHYELMKYSSLWGQVEMFGVAPDMYNKYNTPRMSENLSKKRPKYDWDYLYYNYGGNPIISRLFRRQFTRVNRNYSYENIWDDLKEYNCFVEKLLPDDSGSYKKYFNMSMDYFYLESYKRIDFMFKLLSLTPKEEIQKIDKHHFLAKRFHPYVLMPFVKNERLCLDIKIKYYRPLFMIEQMILEQIHDDKVSDFSGYGIKLQKCQIIRAKVYELFKYHAEYVSSDYEEIKKYISEYYNMWSYHESNDIWKNVKNEKWKDINCDSKRQLKSLINDMQSVSKAFFWNSPDREFTVAKDKR